MLAAHKMKKEGKKILNRKCLQAESLLKHRVTFLDMAVQAALLYFQVRFKVIFTVS